MGMCLSATTAFTADPVPLWDCIPSRVNVVKSSNGHAAACEIKGTGLAVLNATYRAPWLVVKRISRQFDVQPCTYIMSRHKYHLD